MGFSFTMFRLGHLWHHRTNRGDMLQYVEVRAKNSLLHRIAWLLLVYFGGLYLVTALIAIPAALLPKPVLLRFSHMFSALTPRRVWRIRLELVCLLSVASLLTLAGGVEMLLSLYLLPAIAFGLIWSAMQNIYHYDTTTGSPERCNARNIPAPHVVELMLLNFNYHLTHHNFPGIPWYELPATAPDCPPEVVARNNAVSSLINGVVMQLNGPAYATRARELGRDSQQPDRPGGSSGR